MAAPETESLRTRSLDELLPQVRRDASDAITVRGARVHNLRDVDVDIPREQLVVVTGLSGSGKSSLAFDTLYAEGQRRYVESLSAYARQFLDQLEKPEVDDIEGLSPAVSIEQKTVSRNPRSTVGTVTEIADYLRLLFARAGDPHCHQCGQPIASQTVGQMVDRVLGLPEGTRAEVLAPVVRGRKGQYKKELDTFRRQGYVRVRIDGEMHDLGEEIEIAKQSRHDIDVVVDRVLVRERARPRLTESISTALELADGLLKVALSPGEAGGIDDAAEWLFSQHNACLDCGVSMPEISPRLFSFNNPSGACETCAGLGSLDEFVAERVVPDGTKPLLEAVEPWQTGRAKAWYDALLEALARQHDVDPATPWNELPKKFRRAVMDGTGEDVAFEVSLRGRSGRARKRAITNTWDGVLSELAQSAEDDERTRNRLARYRVPRPCPACEGARLRPEARAVKIGGRDIAELSRMPCDALAAFLADLDVDPARRAIADRLLAEITERLRFLDDVGVPYLSLDRASATLSGGESQRIRLATQIGASLMGVLYILDEPSIGLHPRDHRRLLASLERLRDLGNSVLVVEHDEDTIRRADHVIDMGPGAGLHGGEIVAQGTPDELMVDDASLTGAYLAGRRGVAIPKARRKPDERAIVLAGCRANNLQDVTLEIPIGLFTAVTGVSGSGKSSLVNDTLHPALAARLHGAMQPAGPFASLDGVDHIDKVIDVDQSPIGRTPRSNPATYSGVFDGIRQVFSQVPEARMRGYGPGRFSFNVKGGRCESCQGDGSIRVEMNFLPDVFVTCEVCDGRRYNRETLEIAWKGHTIADVLEMSVEAALALFENQGALARPLRALVDVGLGYLHLGQPATTLSGGEAQRIKLARELAKRGTGRTLYLLDEPTTGLHFADVEKLLEMLQGLVEKGNTVVVIEHHLDVVKVADHVVDLGPEGGAAGGRIVATGTPEDLAACAESHTGRALAEVLSR